MMILLCLWWCLCAAIVLMWFFPLCMRACECVWLRVNHLVSFRFVLSFVCSSLSYLFCSFLLFVVSSLFGLSCLFLSLSLFYCALFFFSFSLLACFVSLSLLFLFFCFSLILRFFVRVFYHWVFSFSSRPPSLYSCVFHSFLYSITSSRYLAGLVAAGGYRHSHRILRERFTQCGKNSRGR